MEAIMVTNLSELLKMKLSKMDSPVIEPTDDEKQATLDSLYDKRYELRLKVWHRQYEIQILEKEIEDTKRMIYKLEDELYKEHRRSQGD
jgi:peptidoglycan hydrolase CwlO-like protein